jgi:transcriptional regulator with XRE-family HTH domain
VSLTSNQLGRQLRHRRESLCLSQETLGKLAGLSQARISAIERGQSCNTRTLLRVVDALGCRFEVTFKPKTAEIASRVAAVLHDPTTEVFRNGRFVTQVSRYRSTEAVKAEVVGALKSTEGPDDE